MQQAPMFNQNMQQAPMFNQNMQQAPMFNPNMQQAPMFDQNMQQAPMFNPNMQQAPMFDQQQHMKPGFAGVVQNQQGRLFYIVDLHCTQQGRNNFFQNGSEAQQSAQPTISPPQLFKK